MKRLLFIVFFSLILSACGSGKQTTDVYDNRPDTEITSQPMLVDSEIQPELSEPLKKLKGFWVSNPNIVIEFKDHYLTLLDLESGILLSFVSDIPKDFGRMLSFRSYDSTQKIKVVNIIVGESYNYNGHIESFRLRFGKEQIAPTDFVKANTSVNYQDEFLKASL